MSPEEVESKYQTESKCSIEQARQKWCDKFISWKISENNKITSQVENAARSKEIKISCSKGCSFCCSKFIGASLEECAAIAYWLHQQNMGDTFRSRYCDWHKEILKHNKLYQKIMSEYYNFNKDPRNKKAVKEFKKKTEQYEKLRISCPFLEIGICSIYPVRPFVCTSCFVESLPVNCDPSIKKKPIVIFHDALPNNQPKYFRSTKIELFLTHVAESVYDIMEKGFSFFERS